MQHRPPSLDEILRRPDIWRGQSCAAVRSDSISTGHAELDAVLPGGGWPTGSLTEIFVERPGIGELHLLMPAASRLTRQGRWLALVAPPYVPYAPALASCGIDLQRVLLVRSANSRDQSWACEQLLDSGQCGVVLMWPEAAEQRDLRRLQHKAENGTAVSVLYRPRRAPPCPAAALRLHVSKRESHTVVQVLKSRGSTVANPVRLDLQAALTRRPPVLAEPWTTTPLPAFLQTAC
jgi:cell division inhibitor SulA/protein ImuA